MKERKPLTPYQIRLVQLITDGILATLSLLFSVISIGYLAESNTLGVVFLSIACFFMASIYVSQIFFKEKNKTNYIRYGGLIFFYLALLGITFGFLANSGFYLVFTLVFFVSFIYDTTVKLVLKHKIRSIVLAILKYLLAAFLIVLFIEAYLDPEPIFALFFVFIPLAMAMIGFAHAMMMVFSGIRRTTIVGILRKTYSIEILYGLVVLIVATSLILVIMEDNMSIGDALWYCFAIVTTIGFGDVVATSIVGRVLSVILGIYGIVVVALITSIIVNFYNETKHENDDVLLKEEMKKLDEQRKVEDKEDNKE